jgi:hypothetical protein
LEYGGGEAGGVASSGAVAVVVAFFFFFSFSLAILGAKAAVGIRRGFGMAVAAERYGGQEQEIAH